MNFKQLVAIIVIIGIIIIGYVIWSKGKNNISYVPVDKPKTEEIKINLDGVSFMVPETDLTVSVYKTKLANNTEKYFGQFKDEKDENLKGSIVVLDEFFKESNGNIFVPISVNYGGSGEFVYIAYLKKNEGKIGHIGSGFIGDRVDIDNIEIANKEVKVSFKTHFSDQALLDNPKNPSEVLFSTSDTSIVETKRVTNGKIGDVLLDSPKELSTVGNTFKVKMQALGYWFFEATLVVRVENEKGEKIYFESAESIGEWMTPNLVPFEKEIKLPESIKGNITLIVSGSNASGLPEHEKEARFPLFVD